MKHLQSIRDQALKLRQDGKSIKYIAKNLNISTSTTSIWCRNIELSPEQLLFLSQNGRHSLVLKELGKKRHELKIIRNKVTFEESIKEISILSHNEFFVSGLALYWAEGFKNINEGRVGFCNSDPRMVKFILNWFINCLGIAKEEITLRAEFNQDHSSREEEIVRYWSKLTGIPRIQFNNPYLQKSKWQRDYSHRGTYYGQLRIRVRKSSQLLVKIRGWIEGLNHAYSTTPATNKFSFKNALDHIKKDF